MQNSVDSDSGNTEGGGSPRITALFRKQEEHYACNEEVRHQDKHRCGDHRLCSCAAHTLRAPAHIQTVVATHAGEDKSKNHWLDQPLHEVAKLQGVDGSGPVLHGVEPRLKTR